MHVVFSNSVKCSGIAGSARTITSITLQNRRLFRRQFRDLQHAAYPRETLNAGQQRVYECGQCSLDMAVMMDEQGNPAPIEDAMACIARFSEMKNGATGGHIKHFSVFIHPLNYLNYYSLIQMY